MWLAVEMSMEGRVSQVLHHLLLPATAAPHSSCLERLLSHIETGLYPTVLLLCTFISRIFVVHLLYLHGIIASPLILYLVFSYLCPFQLYKILSKVSVWYVEGNELFTLIISPFCCYKILFKIVQIAIF